MTIKEIAKLAKCSIATVSRVLNNDDSLRVSEKTKNKIIDIAKDTGYQKRKFQSKKSRYKVGIIRMYNKKIELEDTYYLTLRRNLEDMLYEERIMYNLYDIADLGAKELQEIKGLDSILVMGAINDKDIEKLLKYNEDIICIDTKTNVDGVDYIRYDEEKSIKKIIDYILDLGHEKIGFLYGEVRNLYEIEDFRYTYFKRELLRLNLYNEDFFIKDIFSRESGYKMMNQLLRKENIPTLVFCANDSIAEGAYKAIYKAGLKIPDDISIIGFNDLKSSKYMVPSLTTIRINLDNMIHLTRKMLEERLFLKRNYSIKVFLETELVIRKSCKKI